MSATLNALNVYDKQLLLKVEIVHSNLTFELCTAEGNLHVFQIWLSDSLIYNKHILSFCCCTILHTSTQTSQHLQSSGATVQQCYYTGCEKQSVYRVKKDPAHYLATNPTCCSIILPNTLVGSSTQQQARYRVYSAYKLKMTHRPGCKLCDKCGSMRFIDYLIIL